MVSQSGVLNVFRRHMWRVAMLSCVVWAGAACGDSAGSGVQTGGDLEVDAGAVGSLCSFTYECQAGSICSDGRCELARGARTDGADAGDTTDIGAGRDVSQDPDSSSEDADTGDVSGEDVGPDAEPSVRLTFAPDRYRRCRDDLECAVFGGDCLIELPLSRPDASGVDRVRLADLSDQLTDGEGVCTLPCTNDPRVCETLVVDRPGAGTVPFSCQLIFAGTSPYPATPPPFPFDDQLDMTAMARGVSFASICRPPFQHAAAHSESFCEPCLDDEMCSDGDVCFMERGFASPPSGSCVQSCDIEADCPIGFRCEVPAGHATSHCVPIEGTCGRCRDADGDQRGVGRCGPISDPFTEVDCDDTNPVAFFNASRPNHTFPTYCGEFDYNCDGISDRVQQLGTEAHCQDCGDVCSGRVGDVDNAVLACNGDAGVYACEVQCDVGFADCDGDPETGCETQLTSDNLWAADSDGDGRGSLTEFGFYCDGQQPTGWVQNRLDCDDNDPTVYGGNDELDAAPEICDGLDNNCDGVVDGEVAVVGVSESCDTGISGVCGPGTTFCLTDEASGVTELVCVPSVPPETVSSTPEICNGIDDNCNGVIDEGVDFLAEQGVTNPGGPGAAVDCAIEGGVGICAEGTYVCAPSGATAAWVCEGRLPEATDPVDPLGIDSNCDGIDGNLSTGVFVRPVRGGGTLDGSDANLGTHQRPVATLQRAITLACADGAPCRDIYVEVGVYPSTSAVVVPSFTASFETPPVRIYGGYVATPDCATGTCALNWTRGDGRATLRRVAPSRASQAYPFGRSYAAIQGASAAPMSVLLNQINIITESPDPSDFLEDGQSAPTQIGVRCHATAGCGDLVFRDVAIEVEDALSGGAATPTSAQPLPNNNGINGCGSSRRHECGRSTGTVGSSFMEFANAAEATSNANTYSGLSQTCGIGASNRGGNSSAYRYRPPGGGARLYNQVPGGGSGAGAGQPALWYYIRNEGPSRSAQRGSDGRGGFGGTWTSVTQPTRRSEGGYPLISAEPGLSAAQSGTSGGGGGGGAGCLNAGDNSWSSCSGGEVRGGGGGAGGCAGPRGSHGGHGGTTIGVLMNPPASVSASARLIIEDGGGFSVVAGRAGNGGRGGNGGNGGAGGYGGRAINNSGNAAATIQGGNGGDGGGGGGGPGGFGGSSIGVARACTRPGGTVENGCGVELPALLSAQPALYIAPRAAGTGGVGGTGGEVGEKPPNINITDTRRSTLGNSRGGDGADGLDGVSEFIFFAP